MPEEANSPQAPQDGLQLRPDPVFEVETEDYRMTGYVSPDAMLGYVRVEVIGFGDDLEAGKMIKRISLGGISFGIDPAAVENCIEVFSEQPGAGPLQIAAGEAPEDGSDGKIEFYVRPSSDQAELQSDSSGRVDFHDLHLIENVEAGQELASLLEPRPGRAGSTVLGEVLPARGGEPAKTRAGRDVRFDQDKKVFVAELPGRLVHENDVLEISQDYEVRGDVDFHVGDVNFVGRVVVSGEVLDDFNVHAGMGLEVRGPVGNCQLISGGDVTLAAGMSGKMQGKVIAAGRVHARYLNEVTVEAEGDVSVDREAVNSDIRTSGAYLSPGGAVIGGEIMALKGIEVCKAGSHLGVATRLIAGVDYQRALPAARLKKELAELEKQIAHANADIGHLLKDPSKLSRLPADEKRPALNMITRLRVLKQKRGTLVERRKKSEVARRPEPLAQINVKERVYLAVLATLAAYHHSFLSEADGPLSMVPDTDEGLVRVTTYRGLGEHVDEPPPEPTG